MTARRAGRRAAPRTGGRSPRRVVIGLLCVAALGATFAAGVASARRGWGSSLRKPTAIAEWKSWLGIAPRKSAPEAAGDRTRPERPARPVPPAPLLTFYHELTAPLVPVLLPPKAKPSAIPAPRAPAAPPLLVHRELSPPPRAETTPVAPAAAPTTTPAPDRSTGPRFTIQVGAYRTREGAEGLRARLAGGGPDVYIAEATTPGGVRYRVRVGSFPSEDAARTAATKLADERGVPTYVTAR